MATPGNPPRQVFFAQRSHGQSQVEACGASSWYSKIETGCTGELQGPTSEGPAVGGPLLGALSVQDAGGVMFIAHRLVHGFLVRARLHSVSPRPRAAKRQTYRWWKDRAVRCPEFQSSCRTQRERGIGGLQHDKSH